ncbi:MAG: UvrABC system protein A [Verrucomicrobia subdivision 3 bacterium]|nr:UvrABC system protein A [Limisphaerales bacterium]MCS1416423.1 UvrABC system protein A [Limisphaerales bacterium]
MGTPIRLRGIRQNNLKNFDLDIPINQLTVITGVSGSGKSSLAFETLFAEGQRRYIETFSPYARQFFDQMDKPQVDRIDGIPPAIAIKQKNTVKSTRSTIGTMTEICDFMKVLWAHFAQPFCPTCGQLVTADSPQTLWRSLSENPVPMDFVYVVFRADLSAALGIAECLRAIQSQGFQRCLVGGAVRKIDDLLAGDELSGLDSVMVVQDRIRLASKARARFIEACEQAFSFGKDRLALFADDGDSGELKLIGAYSRVLECADCGETIPTPTRSFFSFNSPVGACVECRGFGRVIAIDYWQAIPDSSISLVGGAVKPWQKGHGLRSQRDLMKAAKQEGIPTDIPFGRLSTEQRQWVIFGSPDYGKDRAHRWPKAWYGVKGYFDWLESKAYKMHVRVMLSRYRTYRECWACSGSRFKLAVLHFRVDRNGARGASKPQGENAWITLPEFYALPIKESLAIVRDWRERKKSRRADPLDYALQEVQSRLQFMMDVGLSYLTLDRPTKTLSGGETERINLTTCLGTRLVNTLFVLDEPSVGLHAVDVQNLIGILHRLRDAGNTVVVVEHDAAIIRAADKVVDIGPGSGAAGGALIFSGTVKSFLKRRRSATARFLSGREPVAGVESIRAVGKDTEWLLIREATCHNLSNLRVEIPLNHLVCVTGVSGSGKTTLVKQVLEPSLARAISRSRDSFAVARFEDEDTAFKGRQDAVLAGYESLGAVTLVDQSPVGKTPRSNPALYLGIFENIRKLFAASKQAVTEGLTAGNFSFNSPAGQCERCRGAGFEKVEMQFLSDVFIRCPECDGSRYCRKVREFGLDLSEFAAADAEFTSQCRWTIVAMLDATVDEAAEVLRQCSHAAAQRALTGLQWLQAVGLGYLRLGQPLNTLSGGESQRLKVIRHLYGGGNSKRAAGKTLFIFDEPTTGLHCADVKVLLRMFRTMVQNGHTVLVIEHHLEFIAATDWVIDLGPGTGKEGGQVVVTGPPSEIARTKNSQTGRSLLGLSR